MYVRGFMWLPFRATLSEFETWLAIRCLLNGVSVTVSAFFLVVEVKQLKDTVEQKTRKLEMAEKKTKDLEVRIDVLTSFFREKESDLNQSVDR